MWAFDMEIPMTKLTKTAVTIATMNANADKPMAEVVTLIVAAQHAAGFTDVTDKIAVGAYRWAVKNDKAAGALAERVKAAPKAKVAKAPKVKAAKAVSVATTRKARVVAAVSADTKTADEVEAIRAANLAKIREIHHRMIASGKMPATVKSKAEVAVASAPISVDDELEASRDFPEFLNRDQLGEVLGEL
jgi:hypothetical protein